MAMSGAEAVGEVSARPWSEFSSPREVNLFHQSMQTLGVPRVPRVLQDLRWLYASIYLSLMGSCMI